MFEKFIRFTQKNWRYILPALIALFIGSLFGPSGEEYDAAVRKNAELDNRNEELTLENSQWEEENKQLEAKVKEAEPFFKLKEEERKEKEAELKKKEEAAKAKKEAEEKAAREAEEKAQEEADRLAEEEEKKGYDTGITYDQLARTPDDYIGEKIKFHGTVVQVMEGDGTTQIRFAVGDDYDTILYAEFDSSIVDSRILEDDKITIMGLSTGLLTYESTMGGDISIPGMSIEKVER